MFGAYIPGVDEAIGTIGTWLTNKQNQEIAAANNLAQEQLLQYQNAYNSAEAQKQRNWEEEMSSTAYQRARKDMEAAGINPILLGSSAQAAATPTGYAAASSGSHARAVPVVNNIIQAGVNNGYKANEQFNDTVRTVASLFTGNSASGAYHGTHIGFGSY